MGRRLVLALLAAWIGFFYIAPILIAVLFSFLTPRRDGGVEWIPATAGYDYVRPELFARTGLFAVITAAVSTAAALAISFDALLRPSLLKNKFIMGLALFSLVTNSLIKITSWSLIRSALGIELLYHESVAVLAGLVCLYLPFAMLLVFEGVQSIDPGLIRAARDLGASDRAVVFRILLPLARPFALGAAFVVVVFVFAEFLVPDLLGNGKLMLTGNRMSELFGAPYSNWPACMAIGTVIVALLLAVLALRRREIAPTS